MYDLLLTEQECRVLEDTLHFKIQKEYHENQDFHKVQREYDNMSIHDSKREIVEDSQEIIQIWRKIASIVIAMDIGQVEKLAKAKRS